MADFGVSGAKARRLFTSVAVVESGELWAIELDGRKINTPSANLLAVPFRRLADAVAAEWDAQGDEIDPHSMPLCGLVNASIDRVGLDRATFIDQLARYAASDQICYWADDPPELVARQHRAWQPLLDWAASAIDAQFVVTSGVVHVTQPPEAIQAISRYVEELDDLKLAAVTDLATSLSSVVIALAVLSGEISPDAAYNAAMVDEQFQAEKWGGDSEARARQQGILADVMATTSIFALLE